MSVETCAACQGKVLRLRHVVRGTYLMVDLVPSERGYIVVDEALGTYSGAGRRRKKLSGRVLMHLPHIVSCLAATERLGNKTGRAK